MYGIYNKDLIGHTHHCRVVCSLFPRLIFYGRGYVVECAVERRALLHVRIEMKVPYRVTYNDSETRWMAMQIERMNEWVNK